MIFFSANVQDERNQLSTSKQGYMQTNQLCLGLRHRNEREMIDNDISDDMTKNHFL